MQSLMHLEYLQSQIAVGYIMCTVFSQSGLQQLYLFINTKAKDPLALLFKKLWSEASPRVSQQARLTRSGRGTLLSLHRGTTEAQNAAWCLLGNHPPLSMAVPSMSTKTYVAPATLPKGSLGSGLWGCWGRRRKGSWGRKPRSCWRFGFGVRLIGTFLYPSL